MLARMGKGRLEAFSDGVMAIIITIMVLELRVPDSADWEALRQLAPTFLSYVLSFIFIGILEQPSSSMAGGKTGKRIGPVGESAPAVLVVACAVRDRLDG